MEEVSTSSCNDMTMWQTPIHVDVGMLSTPTWRLQALSYPLNFPRQNPDLHVLYTLTVLSHNRHVPICKRRVKWPLLNSADEHCCFVLTAVLAIIYGGATTINTSCSSNRTLGSWHRQQKHSILISSTSKQWW